MPAPRIAFSTPSTQPRWKRWLLYSPLARILIFAAALVIVAAATGMATDALGWNAKAAPAARHAASSLLMQLLPALVGYVVLVRLVERRRMRELAGRDIATLGLRGLAAGFLLFSVVICILWLAGSYHVVGTRAHPDWLTGVLVAGIGAGIGEEIVTRGVLFRVVEEGLGTWWALLVSAAFFGAAHIGNPNATTWSSVAIMIEAGLLLALLYHVTRSLWTCIGLHAAWNITQGFIYGVPVSGLESSGWLASELSGPDWLSGGAFGAEASVVAVFVCSTASAILLAIAFRRGSIVPPAWRRRAIASQPASA